MGPMQDGETRTDSHMVTHGGRGC